MKTMTNRQENRPREKEGQTDREEGRQENKNTENINQERER